MEKNSERRWRSKVSEGLRVKIPKDIADIYGVKKDDIVEWIFDEKGSIKIEVKEMMLREKKAKVEKVKDTDVDPSPPTLVEAPADKLIPLTKEINKLCKMLDQFCDKLDPTFYDWGSGALATHVLHGLYVLAEKTTHLADKTKRMIEFLEARGKGKGRRE